MGAQKRRAANWENVSGWGRCPRRVLAVVKQVGEAPPRLHAQMAQTEALIENDRLHRLHQNPQTHRRRTRHPVLHRQKDVMTLVPLSDA